MLKTKAYDELENNMKDITDRKFLIVETILGLKDKVSNDVSKMRILSAMSSRHERATWRRKQNASDNFVL